MGEDWAWKLLPQKTGDLESMGNSFVVFTRADITEPMVDYWLVLKLHIQDRINLLQDGDSGANLVHFCNSGKLFYVLLIKWAIRLTKRRLCSRILSSLPNLGSKCLHLEFLGKVKCMPLNVFSWAHCFFLFTFPQQVCGSWRGEREKKSSAYTHLNGIDFAYKKNHVISVWVA